MKSLMQLLKKVLQDCSISCDTTTTRDFLTVSRRTKHEGLSFLTITLGDFASDFERSLELGHIEPSFFRSFSKKGLIPKFLSGITSLVFSDDGNLRDFPSLDAIFYIRQICRMYKKIELPCTAQRLLAAEEGYIAIEEALSMLDIEKTAPDHFHDFGVVSDILWSKTLSPVILSLAELSHIPRHGPGSTAQKVLPNQKYDWVSWHHRLEDFFPSAHFCYNSSMAFLEESSKISFLTPEQEPPVRVVFVPKTLKAPRVIAVEPACMQYTQQSILSLLVPVLEKSRMTSRHINFSDQSINASLALENSDGGFLATLDLSEASDRVHYSLVKRMLRSCPTLLEAIDACRSTRALLPCGKTIHLEKFASMGSALCFPIESMVFYTILIAREIRRLGLPLSARSIDIVRRNVYVYGDDLILPVDGVSSASIGLSALGLKVNPNKSFSVGNFRESCGVDAYAGLDVTTVYVRRMPPRDRRDAQGLVSWVSLANQLYDKRLFNAAAHIRDTLATQGFGVPYVRRNSSCVGYTGYASPTVQRYNDKLHRHEVHGYVVVAKPQLDSINGYQGLMKWFLQGLNPDRKHFERSVGSGRLAIKRRWCSVYY
jgi:hypothetical protein